MTEKPTSSFSQNFAAALRGYMRERGIRQSALAERLEKSPGYVSEHLSGLRAVNTDMLDAAAELAGTDTRHVLMEMTRRMEIAAQESARSEPVSQTAGRIVSEARSRVSEQSGGSAEEGKRDTPKRTGSP